MEWGSEFWKQAGSDPCVHAAQRTSSLQHPARKWVVRQCEEYLAPHHHPPKPLTPRLTARQQNLAAALAVHGNSANSNEKAA